MKHISLLHMVLAIVLVATILLPRVSSLGLFITADEPRWQANVVGFTTKLARGDIGHLLQQSHPGITTQWFASPGIWSDSWAGKKIPLVIAQCVLLMFAGYLLIQLWGIRAGFFGTLFLAIDPFLIAHTRVYAMDSLLAIFCLLSILALLVWNKTNESRYIAYAGIAGALAFLSKLPGIILLPFCLIAILALAYQTGAKNILKNWGIWITAFVCTAIIVLPSLLVRPFGVVGDMTEFFSSGDYTSLHHYGAYYYVGTLFFLTSIIQIVALIIFLIRPSIITRKKDVAVLLIFAVLFVVMMTLGAKKGDRYILPAFLMFDVCAGYIAGKYFASKKHRWAIILLISAIVFQTADLVRLHPYELAYVNPLTKQWLGDRQLGWGEGLDIAATYLNAKNNAENSKVASYYATQFAPLFHGETAPLHQWDSGSIDYAVLYRAMYGRGSDAWETDVLEHFANKIPEKVISLDGVPYVWIYNLHSLQVE